MFQRGIVKISQRLKKIYIPLTTKVPLYDILKLFLNGIQNGAITTRASSIAFNFLMALFPGIIFLFTIIPYITIEGFQENLFSLIEVMLPADMFNLLNKTIEDILIQPHGNLLSLGFFLAFYYATNGISALIAAFNATSHQIETRSWWSQKVISLMLLLIIFMIVTAGIIVIILTGYINNTDIIRQYIDSDIVLYSTQAISWIVTIALLFFGYAFLFYYAPDKRSRFKFISAGGTVATILTVAISIGFSFYINNFAQYNTIYGSIGTVIVSLMWLYLNSLAILIGYELNISLNEVKDNGIEK